MFREKISSPNQFGNTCFYKDQETSITSWNFKSGSHENVNLVNGKDCITTSTLSCIGIQKH